MNQAHKYNNKALLINSKVRCVITCQECRKSRCIFAAKKLDLTAKKKIDDIDSLKVYTCGSFLFPQTSSYSSTVVVRLSLIEETLLNDDEIMELKRQYAIVRPICFLCHSSGKRPSTRQPNLTAKKQKK